MLEKLKALLGVEGKDDMLKSILEITTGRLTLLIGGIEPPEELEHIIVEVSVIRYNRIGSEGLSSHSVEGESLSFNENDFAGYMDEIEAFLALHKGSKLGKVRFI
jgi:hypothetical protein